jgi:hypothetical protein
MVTFAHGPAAIAKLVESPSLANKRCTSCRKKLKLAGTEKRPKTSGSKAIEAPYLGEQLPGPGDGLLLEVVPKGPVPQHLKESVVVRVLANVIQVIVLPCTADGERRFFSICHEFVGCEAAPQMPYTSAGHEYPKCIQAV